MVVKIDWANFEKLTGRPEENFEKLCYHLVRTHYGSYGNLRRLPNQPGIEFDLQLTQRCDLGDSRCHYGWQCKWYQISSGQKLGRNRQKGIEENLITSIRHFPDLTDWVLWTRHKLSKQDQEWFQSLGGNYPKIKLHLYTSENIESLLSGPALLYRDTYFGELIITGEMLQEHHESEVSMFESRHPIDLHCSGSIERKIQGYLGDPKYWKLNELANQLKKGISQIDVPTRLSSSEKNPILELICDGKEIAKFLDEIDDKLNRAGDLEVIKSLLKRDFRSPYAHQKAIKTLHLTWQPTAFLATNLVADLHKAISVLKELENALNTSSIAILAKAGWGKSEMAFHITRPTDPLIGGVVLHGRNLQNGQDLSGLIRNFGGPQINIQKFEDFVFALNSMGQRENRRIPIVIDGLNEAGDPKQWKYLLSKNLGYLQKYSHILFVITLRPGFSQQCLPENFPKESILEISHDTDFLIRHYFEHYNINIDEEFHPSRKWLKHPLTLKIYCEILNSDRHNSKFEEFPVSLIGLLEKYFQNVAEQIAEISPPDTQVYDNNVYTALLKIGEILWEKNERSINREELCAQLGNHEPWRNYLLRSLESAGILIETPYYDNKTERRISVVHDLMAGQLIAKYLLGKEDIEDWLRDPLNMRKLNLLRQTGRTNEENQAYTFAKDISYALVGLIHKLKPELWQILKTSSSEKLRKELLLLTTETTPEHINSEMIEELNMEAQKSIEFSQKLYPQICKFRSVRNHPLNTRFLDQMLRDMDNTARDISWSEWLRKDIDRIIWDIELLEKRWTANNDLCNQRDMNRARWLMWTLTSTSHYLRDISTRALYALAQRMPTDYFKLAIESFSISDPYVPERMMAAAYGAALTQWSRSEEIRKVIVDTAQKLEQMLGCSAKNLTHIILRRYCLGIIVLAKKIKLVDDSPRDIDVDIPNILSLNHLLSPFEDLKKISSDQIEKADKSAIMMDFGNYTIGTLVKDRANYDFNKKEYQDTRKSIVSRMLQLGYDPDRFESCERDIISASDRQLNHRLGIDRYGKKYSWIAYYEMYGHRSDNQKLPDYCRPYDRVDIDPTFPSLSESWTPNVSDVFGDTTKDMMHWIVDGPSPDYTKLLTPPLEIDSTKGKWILLDGFIEENAKKDPRKIFTFLRGIFVNPDDLDKLLQQFDDMDYPGNEAIPSAPDHYYTYAGEIPLGHPFNFQNCNDNPIQHSVGRFGASYEKEGIKVDIPVLDYVWEKPALHNGRIVFPSYKICQHLDLRYQGKCDLYDHDGKIGSLYREVGSYQKPLYGKVSYLREDLFKDYLKKTNQKFVWLIWGERSKQFNRYDDGPQINPKYYEDNKHIHKYRCVFGE